MRISKRAGMAILLVVIGLLLAFAYGGYRRTQKAQAAARDAGLPKNVGPATQAGNEFTSGIHNGSGPIIRKNMAELLPPGAPNLETTPTSCGSNPQTGQPYRFNPQTGQPCDGLPQERLLIRQAPAQAIVRSLTAHEGTPEEQRLAAAYAREQEARIAPTGIRSSAAQSSLPDLVASSRSSGDGIALMNALNHSADQSKGVSASDSNRAASQVETEYDTQNMQTHKESFLASARSRQRRITSITRETRRYRGLRSRLAGRFRRYLNKASTPICQVN